MRKLNQYKVRDNRTFSSINQAEDHCLANAHIELKNLLDMVFQFRLDNTHAIAQQLVLHGDTLASLKSIVAWLEDAQYSDDED